MSIDVSKLNVINRDYRAIYKDLTNTIPTLTNQWSTNDESDPGVVLVKLMSMLGDMLSYNTDKAYLEAFPDTVTQRKNAYQIFKLVGYKMNWYRSAVCKAYFDNIGSQKSDVVYLPRFTKFVSSDGTICYTNPLEDIYVVADISGAEDSRQQTELVEGIPVTPDIYADSTLTSKENGSYVFNNNTAWHSVYKYNVYKNSIVENRIYFNTKNVEQNYIMLVDDNGDEWKKVDNIDTASNLNEKIFEFDVDEFDKPYIKLVNYWEELDISKFKLFFIESSGKNGKINANVLKEAKGNAFTILNGKYPDLNIVNFESSDGYDPETPDDARKESAKYINTFDTLVTLDDFSKFVKRFKYVGNAIAKDITNDFNRKTVSASYTLNDIVNNIISSYNINTTEFESLTPNDNFSNCVSYSFDVTNLTASRTFSQSVELFGDIINNSNGSYLGMLIGVANLFGVSYSDGKFYLPSGEELSYASEETAKICDLYETIYLSNKDYDTTKEKRYTNEIKCVSNLYFSTTGRNIINDLTTISELDDITSNSVNIYITPSDDYSIQDFKDYKEEIEEQIYNSKMMPLNVNTTVTGINYYNWSMSGTVYLKNPVSYNKSQEILVSINNKIKEIYSVENIGYNNPIKQIELVNTIMSADAQIYYVDIDKIEYTLYDALTDETIGDVFTDKNVISGNRYIQDIPYSDVFSNLESGGTHFEIDLLNDEYTTVDGAKNKYITDYDEVDFENGNVLIRPNSFCAIIDNGSYIIKDNGYGSLVCNEDILDSSIINYKKSNGKLTVKFDVSANIDISTTSTVNVKFSTNKTTMARYVGLNPSKFTIDSESIEV